MSNTATGKIISRVDINITERTFTRVETYTDPSFGVRVLVWAVAEDGSKELSNIVEHTERVVLSDDWDDLDIIPVPEGA